MLDWKPIDTAPKDGTMFLAWYVSDFGPSFGPMSYIPNATKPDKGYFMSWSILSETQKAKFWASVDLPTDKI